MHKDNGSDEIQRVRIVSRKPAAKIAQDSRTGY